MNKDEHRAERRRGYLDGLVEIKQESLALASIARDDPPTSSTASSTAPPVARRPQCAVKWDRNLKPKLDIMRL